MQAAFGENAHFQAALCDEAHQGADQLLGLIGLVQQGGGLADIGRGRFRRQSHVDAAGEGQRLHSLLNLFQTAVALGDLLDSLPTGGVADEQAQFSHVGQLLGHGFQAGEEKVADGKAGRLAAGQDAVDVVYQFIGAVVYDVVGHGSSFPKCRAPGIRNYSELFGTRTTYLVPRVRPTRRTNPLS